MATIETDLLVIGAGVAGGLIADALGSDMRVLVIDAGPEIDRQETKEKFWAAPIKVPEAPYPDSPEYAHPRVDRLGSYYVQEGPEDFQSTYLKVVGGTTWHWLGTALRLVPDDFRMLSAFGHAVDWPLTYDDLEPHYLAAEKAIGVAGDSREDLGSPRSGDFPMGEIPQTYLDLAFAKALEGSAYPVKSTPQARNSMVFEGRPPCCGSNSCIPVCPIGAKYDATVTLNAAKKKGVQVMPSTVAVSLNADPGGRITSVEVHHPDRSSDTINAKAVVVAAHGIETPRLLLNSASEAFPDGIANRSGAVGRHLMDHPVRLSYALANDPLWPFRGPLSTSGIERHRASKDRRDLPSFRIEIGNDGWSWPTGAPTTTARTLADDGLRGKALDEALVDHCARQVRLATLVEQLPMPDNRISLDPDKRDFYGVPLPRIAYRVHEYAQKGLDHAAKVHGEIFDRLGVSEQHHADGWFGAGHIMGTARMGADAASSVVNADGRAHDHDNLFVVGSAVFPTAGSANPTLTIAALTLKAVPAVKAAVEASTP